MCNLIKRVKFPCTVYQGEIFYPDIAERKNLCSKENAMAAMAFLTVYVLATVAALTPHSPVVTGEIFVF